MFGFKWRKEQEAPGLEAITRKFEQMLEDGRHTFDASANTLLGGSDPNVIREDLFQTDKRINRMEQEIRRALVVHGAVHGALSFPELLVMMSLVKDAERIGDYAKNIFDLAVHNRTGFAEDELQLLVQLKDQISKLLVRARNIYDQQDEEAARKFLEDCDKLEDQCDESVHRLLAVKGLNKAGSVLTYRYFKRVISHIANIVTSLVMPIDKLDFFDEPKV
jgi:phosphate uptake regulator